MSRKHYKNGKYAFAVPMAGSTATLVAGGTGTVGNGAIGSGGSGSTGGSSGSGSTGNVGLVVTNPKLSTAEQFERVVAVTEPITPVVVKPTQNDGSAVQPEKPVPTINPNIGGVATSTSQEPTDTTLPGEPVTPTGENEEPAPTSGGKRKWLLWAVVAVVLFMLFRKRR
ncbi:MAG: DUF3999 domain-containing protein [Bacteroides sp.]|nr:DUF3999 domain-containing protein [Bacteroides sp.]